MNLITMESLLECNKPLTKYTVSDLRTLCASTQGILNYRSLKKKELYEKVIQENVFDMYMNQKEKRETERKMKLEREEKVRIYEDEQVEKRNNKDKNEVNTEVIRKRDIHEYELVYGDYYDVMNKLDKIEDDKERMKYLIEEFELKEEDFKFGNYMCFSTTRQSGLYMVSKDNKLENNFGEYGYELPISISEYLVDAVQTFKNLEFHYFELSHQDFTVVSSISGSIPTSWNISYDVFEDMIYVEDPETNRQCSFNKNDKKDVAELIEYFN